MEKGLLHGGPPCSSWVWINRGTSGRSASKPEGAAANMIAEAASLAPAAREAHGRFALMVLVAIAQCVYVVVEQPRSSVMPDLKQYGMLALRLGKYLHVQWRFQNFHMAVWGAPTAQPTKVFGTAPWMKHLYVKYDVKFRRRVAKKGIKTLFGWVI